MQQKKNTIINEEVTQRLMEFLKAVVMSYTVEITTLELYTLWAELTVKNGGNVSQYFKYDASVTISKDEALARGRAIADDLGVDIAQMKDEMEAPYRPKKRITEEEFAEWVNSFMPA